MHFTFIFIFYILEVNNLMIKILFKINIVTILIFFILKSILKFFYYYKIKSLIFKIFFLPYFNNFLNMTFSNKLYEMLQICLLNIFFNDLN